MPLVAGKDVILVVCDKLSKITHFVATMERTSAKELVWLFRDNISKMKAVDLIYFPFLFYLHFLFDLFSIFLSLELMVRVRVTRSCSHIK